MKKHHISLFVALCLACVTSMSGNAQESHSLRYKLAKGKTYRYADVIKANQTQEMMGQEVKSTTVVSSVIRVLVDDVASDGGMVLTASADSLKVSAKSNRLDTTMVLENMLGKRTRVHLSTTGTISGREIIDSIKLEGLAAGLGLREFIRFQRLAEQPVKMGDKWHITSLDSIDMMGGKMVTSSELDYVLAGNETKLGHECLKLTYTGKTAISGKGKMGGMDIFTEGTGKVTGALYFDYPNGLTVAEDGTNESEMTAAITGQQNMTIPISMSLKTTRTLLAK